MDSSLVGSALYEGRPLLVGGLHFVMAAAVTVHALMTKRDVPAAIGWIGMAWLAPVLGALLYAGFGINRVKRRARRLKGRSERHAPPRNEQHFVGGPDRTPKGRDREDHRPGHVGGQSRPQCSIAAIKPIPQMLAAIESAKFHIRLSTYIFRTDDVGLQFIGALVRAHRRG